MVFPKFMKDLSNFTHKILSKFISAYKKSYSSNYALLKLFEKWKKFLDDKNIGAVLMDLPKA